MSYTVPELSLIGQASGVVLGGTVKYLQIIDSGNASSDPALTSDTEW